MEIIQALPPNWKQIKRAYNPDERHVVVTYGDKIYNPGGNPIDRYLLSHELTHSVQQEEMGVKEWWIRYLNDPSFMLTQEVEAYRKQYKSFCKDNVSKKLRKEFVQNLARHLSSEMYGENISQEAAEELIKT